MPSWRCIAVLFAFTLLFAIHISVFSRGLDCPHSNMVLVQAVSTLPLLQAQESLSLFVNTSDYIDVEVGVLVGGSQPFYGAACSHGMRSRQSRRPERARGNLPHLVQNEAFRHVILLV
eukprot:877704-Amphidinium_carterae.1